MFTLGYLLALTIVAEIGDISRFPNARKLIGYAGLAPTIKQSGQSSWVGPISKAGSPMLRWAAVEAAQHAWRPSNPWNQLYLKTKARHGKANPAKGAVARKILIACWHVLAREQEFRPTAPILTTPAPDPVRHLLFANSGGASSPRRGGATRCAGLANRSCRARDVSLD